MKQILTTSQLKMFNSCKRKMYYRYIMELVPKKIALSNPDRFARAVAPTIRVLCRLFSPITKLLNLSSGLLIKLLGIDTSSQPDVSVEELRLMIDEGAVTGVLEPLEEIMLEQVLRFDDATIKALITPRAEINWLDKLSCYT